MTNPENPNLPPAHLGPNEPRPAFGAMSPPAAHPDPSSPRAARVGPSSPRAARVGPSGSQAALIGLTAAALTFGLAELIAAVGAWINLLNTSASPSASLGAGFIEITPEWLKSLAIDAFGEKDKTALRVGMYLTIAVAAAAIGLIARRSLRMATAATVLLLGVVVVAILTRAESSVLDAVPIVLAGFAGNAFLRSAIRRIQPEDTAVEQSAGRRDFFRLAGLGALAAVTTGALSRWIPNAAQVEASRAAVILPPLSNTPTPTAAGTLDSVPGISPFVTPNADFYRIDTAFTFPRLTAEDWKLRIHGLVANPFEITFAELLQRPMIERQITLTCVSNEVGGTLAGNALWRGVRIADLLKQAGPLPESDAVLSTSAQDRFTVSTPLAALTDDRDSLLAIGMNGEPLPIANGFPVRMVVPGLYGYVSATKWVVDLEVTRFDKISAYWTQRGWAEQAPIKTASRIDVPAREATVSAGTVAVAGVAWAQHRGIDKVQVQVDDGEWQDARLSAPPSVDTWRQWVYEWAATPGEHRLRVRATDGTGTVQTEAEQDVIPDGATGWHTREITVR